jgi:hypothetical protein
LSHTFKKPLHSGDRQPITIPYRVDDTIHRRRDELYPQLVQVRAYVDGALVAEVARPVSELQCF